MRKEKLKGDDKYEAGRGKGESQVCRKNTVERCLQVSGENSLKQGYI
jgi:hypothetical protein